MLKKSEKGISLSKEMNREELLQSITQHGKYSAARSGGPGGQNVNKVNSKIVLSLCIREAEFLSAEEKGRIRQKLAGRINTRDELVLHVSEERSQLLNRAIAAERMCDLILGALKRPRRRKKTVPGRAAREKRLDKKRKQSQKKRNRSRSPFMD